jgi:hypothetical protein
MKLILKNNRAIATHSDDQDVVSLYGDNATEVIVPEGTEVNLETGEYDESNVSPVPKRFTPLKLIMALESIGKADAVIAEMTDKEKMMFNSATEIVESEPEYALVDAFIERAVASGVLTQAEVDAILGGA